LELVTVEVDSLFKICISAFIECKSLKLSKYNNL